MTGPAPGARHDPALLPLGVSIHEKGRARAPRAPLPQHHVAATFGPSSKIVATRLRPPADLTAPPRPSGHTPPQSPGPDLIPTPQTPLPPPSTNLITPHSRPIPRPTPLPCPPPSPAHLEAGCARRTRGRAPGWSRSTRWCRPGARAARPGRQRTTATPRPRPPSQQRALRLLGGGWAVRGEGWFHGGRL